MTGLGPPTERSAPVGVKDTADRRPCERNRALGSAWPTLGSKAKGSLPKANAARLWIEVVASEALAVPWFPVPRCGVVSPGTSRMQAKVATAKRGNFNVVDLSSRGSRRLSFISRSFISERPGPLWLSLTDLWLSIR